MSQPEEERPVQGDVEMADADGAEESPAAPVVAPAEVTQDVQEDAGHDSEATADKSDDEVEATNRGTETEIQDDRPATAATSHGPPPSAKSKSLREFLSMMDEYAPIVSFASKRQAAPTILTRSG